MLVSTHGVFYRVTCPILASSCPPSIRSRIYTELWVLALPPQGIIDSATFSAHSGPNQGSRKCEYEAADEGRQGAVDFDLGLPLEEIESGVESAFEGLQQPKRRRSLQNMQVSVEPDRGEI